MSRINKALKFIDANLDSDLSLEKIADSAHYSPYHFHRIFKAIHHLAGHSLVCFFIRFSRIAFIIKLKMLHE